MLAFSLILRARLVFSVIASVRWWLIIMVTFKWNEDTISYACLSDAECKP